jgi:hypothetical protein
VPESNSRGRSRRLARNLPEARRPGGDRLARPAVSAARAARLGRLSPFTVTRAEMHRGRQRSTSRAGRKSSA